MLSIGFWVTIHNTKSQTGNILGVSRIWKNWKVINAIRCSKLIGFNWFLFFNWCLCSICLLMNIVILNNLIIIEFSFQVCSVIFKPLMPSMPPPRGPQYNEQSSGCNCNRCKTFCSNLVNVEIWKNMRYVIWVLAISSSLFGYFVPYVHLVSTILFSKIAIQGGKRGLIFCPCWIIDCENKTFSLLILPCCHMPYIKDCLYTKIYYSIRLCLDINS